MRTIIKFNNHFNALDSTRKHALLRAFVVTISILILSQTGLLLYHGSIVFPAMDNITMPLRLHTHDHPQREFILQIPGQGLPRSALERETIQ